MKKATSVAVIVILLIVELQVISVSAAPSMSENNPPIVNAGEVQVNASISSSNGVFWANIDAEYQMHTIYGFGDSYVAQNSGMGLLTNPSPYVTVTINQNILQ